MRPMDFKKWQIFLNTNGYLSIVYDIKGDKIYVLNYNGSVYTISRNSEYSYNVYDPAVEGDFFENFPSYVFYGDQQRIDRFNTIRARFILERGHMPERKKLLLTIKSN